MKATLKNEKFGSIAVEIPEPSQMGFHFLSYSYVIYICN